jgi:hypothetical protein
MDINLSTLTEEELIALNHRIVERIKFLRQGRYHQTMVQFSVGDRVSFQPECGHEVVGTIVRLNRKSVTVVNAEGHQWRVSPTFLKKAEAAVGAKAADLISLADERLRRGGGG